MSAIAMQPRAAGTPSLRPPASPVSAAQARPRWQRAFWLTAGALACITGGVGIFIPLLPTTPFVLLAAWCLARGSQRWEAWLLAHPRFGPMVRSWRQTHAIPLRVKQLAWAMMTVGSVWAFLVMPSPWGLLPAVVCAAVGVWVWRLPTGG